MGRRVGKLAFIIIDMSGSRYFMTIFAARPVGTAGGAHRLEHAGVI